VSHGGRLIHDFWENGDSKLRQEGKKIVPNYQTCKKILANAVEQITNTQINKINK